MRKKHILCASLVLCCPAPAIAAPIISGTYNVVMHSYCQPVLTANFAPVGNDFFVDGLDKSNSDAGDAFHQELVAATFNAAKGKVTFNGFSDTGSVYLLQFSGSRSGTIGTALSETPHSGSAGYSNTDTTLTLGGSTSNTLYGQIDKNGIAHSFVFMRLSGGQGGTSCSTQGEATRQ